MGEVRVDVLNVFEHFEYKSEFNHSINGLYKIRLNGENYMIFRNGDSWGALSHCLGEPVTKCIGFVRRDRIEILEKSINKYLEENEIKSI